MEPPPLVDDMEPVEDKDGFYFEELHWRGETLCGLAWAPLPSHCQRYLSRKRVDGETDAECLAAAIAETKAHYAAEPRSWT